MSDSSTHVLVVGIDGVRYDTLLEVATPVIDRIAEQGFLRKIRVNDAGPTISGPSWSTITTGVLAPVHDIWNNEISPNNLAANPDFVHLARTELGAATFTGAAWPPLVSEISGGPILADGGLLPGGVAPTSEQEWHDADQAVADAAVAFVSELTDPVSASLVYLGGCDAICHADGVGDSYRTFVEASDRRLGEVLAAVEARPNRADETWSIIVVTDHGHLDPGGHGGDSDLERTAWIAACGAGVRGPAEGPLEQADVAGHVFSVLGLRPRSSDFFGVPFGERTDQAA